MNLQRFAFCALTALAATGAMTVAPSAEARTYVDVNIGVAPPPLRYERVVERRGYVWVPGYWSWNGHRHVWVAGYSAPERHGYHYYPSRWDRDGRYWRFHNGYWGH